MPDEIEKEKYFEEIKAKKEKIEKMRKITSWVAGMTSSIAIAVTISMAAGLFFSKTKTLSREELSTKVSQIEILSQDQREDISKIKNDLESIKNGLEAVSSLPKGAEWKAEASQLTHQLSDISNRMSALEAALTVNPSRALAVPILRKDLDNAEKTLRAELTQTRAEIDRMYDQNKWFIGLMFTIAISVLGMAVSSFFNRKDT